MSYIEDNRKSLEYRLTIHSTYDYAGIHFNQFLKTNFYSRVIPQFSLRIASLRAFTLAAGLLLALMTPARAQTWTGAGSDSNWSTNANWNTGVAPFYTNSPYYPVPTANVNFDGSTRTTVNVDPAPTNYVNSLGFASTAGAFTLNNGTIGITGNFFDNSANTQTINSNLTIVNNQTWNISAGKVVFNGVVSDPFYITLTKSGAGELELTGTNTWTGPIVVNGGTVLLTNSSALGTAESGNEINSGATLDLNGGIAVNESGFTLSGTGVSNNGVLLSSGGNNTLGGQVTLGAASTIQVSSGSLTLSGPLSLAYNLIWTGAGNGTISNQISGAGLFDKTGTGTLTFTGSSGITNTLGLQIDGGTVILDQASGANTWNGPIVVGNNTSAVGSSILQLAQSDQIADSLAVTVNNSGIFDLNGNNETIAGLTMTGGTVKSGAGTLSLSSSGGGVTTNASGNIAVISGNLQLQAATSTFTIARGTAATDLAVSAAISGSSSIVKTGAGILVFNGTTADTFTRTVTVNAGTLTLSKTAGVNAIAGSGVIVNTGGTLMLGAANQISSSTAMTLAGGTFNTNGLHEGTATTAGLGTLTLSASSTINLGAGSSIVAFTDSHTTSWTASQTLSITNWSGSLAGNGTDQIYFGTTSSGLTSTQLNEIQFINPSGLSAGDYGAKLLPTGELVPFSAVPEPSTYAAGAALGLLATFDFWRRRRNRR
jgi:autotransporter-associated beta strand protein